MVIYQEPLFIVWEWENVRLKGWTRRTDWSSSEILSLSLFTPPPYIFDSQKKPNDSQDKFYFLSCGCGGFEESRTKGGLITRTHTRKKHINILKCDFISAAADSPDLAAITYIDRHNRDNIQQAWHHKQIRYRVTSRYKYSRQHSSKEISRVPIWTWHLVFLFLYNWQPAFKQQKLRYINFLFE